MKLLIVFALLSFVSLFYVVASQKEEKAFTPQDLDVPSVITNSTNDTLSEVHHGFKSKVGKVVGKVKTKVGKVVGKVKNKITKVIDKIKGGGGGSGGGSSGGGSSGGSGYRYRPVGNRYNRNSSGSGSYSNLSVTDVLFIVFGLTGGILLLTGIIYFVCNKVKPSEVS